MVSKPICRKTYIFDFLRGPWVSSRANVVAGIVKMVPLTDASPPSREWIHICIGRGYVCHRECSRRFSQAFDAAVSKSIHLIDSISSITISRCLPTSPRYTIFPRCVQRMVLLQKEKCWLHRIPKHQRMWTVEAFERQTGRTRKAGAEYCWRRGSARDPRSHQVVNIDAAIIRRTIDHTSANCGASTQTIHWHLGRFVNEKRWD